MSFCLLPIAMSLVMNPVYLSTRREGAVLPVLLIRLAAPRAPGCILRHSLRDAATGQVWHTLFLQQLFVLWGHCYVSMIDSVYT